MTHHWDMHGQVIAYIDLFDLVDRKTVAEA